jgi:membrane protein insertase Oxa1/YidC/SpoIIIJ
MADFFYTLIIFPIEQILSLCFYFTGRVFHSPAIAVFGVSVGVSFLTLPLYFRAEYWQNLERDTQKKLRAGIKKIKAVFSGDEQFMILSTYYRQNHYHPFYALRNSLGILIQIPFFIAAYHYLSRLDAIKGISFLVIKDLGAPDGLIPLAGGINALPLIMTLINVVSGAIYTKGFPVKDKIQLYGMAAIFLVLLYNSPAGLVLYWTSNNIFSLVKNIFQKIKNSKTIIFAAVFFCVGIVDIFLLFFHRGDLPNRLAAALFISLVYLLPFIPTTAKKLFSRESMSFRSYALSCAGLFVLLGIVIPSTVITSSVEEFSFLGSFSTPFPFLLTTALQSAGIFVFWAPALYFLFPDLVRKSLTFVMLPALILSLVNTFLVHENYGFLTNMLIFSDVQPFGSDRLAALLSVVLPLGALAAVLLLWVFRGFRILEAAQFISLMALLVLSGINLVQIHKGYATVLSKKDEGNSSVEKVFSFSKSGKNVMLVMLDCLIGSYMPYIFKERPELLEIFNDFTHYPNTASFSNHTLVGALPVFGGYEYTPVAVNSRRETTLLEKQKEAYLLLPELFANKGYSVTFTDPPFDNYQMSNLSIFEEDKRINAQNIVGKWTFRWLQNNPDLSAVDISEILYARLIRFSFFRISPLIARPFIYDGGDWLMLRSMKQNVDITPTILNDYALLDLLPDLTTVQDEGDTYTAIYSHLGHNTILLQAPDYTITSNVTNRGTSILRDDKRYHVSMASFILVAKYLTYLKELGVYDNTRVILVSDHGRGRADYPENITLPDGSRMQTYNPLLMVKDFGVKPSGAEGPEIISRFMTNADAALIALDRIIENPVNPWTGKPLTPDKEKGATIATIGALSTYRHSKYVYNIRRDQWLHVHDDIYKPENWSAVTIP